MSRKTAWSDAFWHDFVFHSGIDADDYAVCSFGDSPAMATELADLVIVGTKRATASLARDYADGREPLPKVGDHVVVVDGDGAPCCIWRTVEIVVQPLIAVDEGFAWDEGEGDRTRAWWLDAHREYFKRQAAREGFTMHDRIETVFVRFEIVWPLLIADRSDGTKR
jgi:uncharacterized protein YhfF